MVCTICERPQKPVTATTAIRRMLAPKATASLFPIFKLLNMIFPFLLVMSCSEFVVDGGIENCEFRVTGHGSLLTRRSNECCCNECVVNYGCFTKGCSKLR